MRTVPRTSLLIPPVAVATMGLFGGGCLLLGIFGPPEVPAASGFAMTGWVAVFSFLGSRRPRFAAARFGEELLLTRPQAARLNAGAMALPALLLLLTFPGVKGLVGGVTFLALLVGTFGCGVMAWHATSGRWMVDGAGVRVETPAILGKATREGRPWGEVQRLAAPEGKFLELLGARGTLQIPVGLDGIGDLARVALASIPERVRASHPDVNAMLEALAAGEGTRR